MAGNLVKTKRRIASIAATKKITSAMGMIASVKLLREKKAIEFARFASAESRAFLDAVRAYSLDEPLLEEGEGKRAYIVFSSDLGLCGAYNQGMFRLLSSKYREGDLLIPIGAKAKARYGKGGYPLLEGELSMFDSPRSLLESAKRLLQMKREGRISSLRVIYTKYINSLRFDPAEEVLLPLPKLEPPFEVKPIIEPSEERARDEALATWLSLRLLELKEECSLCEQSSRRNAMDAANTNADELLEKLNIEYNKARQAAITQEITEVVSGSR